VHATTTLKPGNLSKYGSFFLRLALGAAFLSAVADRLGLWGAAGEPGVAWGDFENFLAYTATLTPYLPNVLVAPVGWLATLAEVVLGVALIGGLHLRRTALASGFLLLAFGVSMILGDGIKAPLDASVFTASAAAFVLALQSHGAPS